MPVSARHAQSPRLLLAAVASLFGLLALPTTARPADEEGGQPLDRFFRGQVVSLERGVVTLRYDFAAEEQMKDWPEGIPFRVRRASEQGVGWAEDGLEIRGSTGVRHLAEWQGDVEVKVRYRLDTVKDVGGYLNAPGETEDYAIFTLREKYFHHWDRQPGGQHSIIKFGRQWREAGSTTDFVGFRYVARRPPPEELVSGRSVEAVFGLRRKKLVFDVQGLELKGKDLGNRLKVSHPGFYAIKGHVVVDDVEISGRLDEAWRKAEGVALALERPARGGD